MSDPFRTAADNLLSLKPQFEQLPRFVWSCELYFWADQLEGFDGWDPVRGPVQSDSSDPLFMAPGGLEVKSRLLRLPPGQQPPPWAFACASEPGGTGIWQELP